MDQQERFVTSVLTLAGKLERLSLVRARSLGASDREVQTLRMLLRGKILQKDLTEGLGVDHTTGTRNMKLLEKKALLKRTVHKEDGRLKWVELTAKGRKAARIAMSATEKTFLELVPVGSRTEAIGAAELLSALLSPEEAGRTEMKKLTSSGTPARNSR
jgi:DNA-binding MarR family transcriptional regulator